MVKGTDLAQSNLKTKHKTSNNAECIECIVQDGNSASKGSDVCEELAHWILEDLMFAKADTLECIRMIMSRCKIGTSEGFS